MFSRIYLEITNCCNLSCAFCPGTRRARRMLPAEEFRLLAGKLRPWTDYLYLHVLGEPLLHGDVLNENVGVEKIREYVYFTDTKASLPESHPDEPYFMGVHIGSAYYFYYEKQAVTTLNREFLHTVKTKADSYVIYADLCTLSEAELEKYHITFKKIPRDITKL